MIILDSKNLFITSIVEKHHYETEILPRLASYSIFYFLIIFFLPSGFLCVNPPVKGGSFGQNRDFMSILDSKNLFITSI